MINQRNAVNDVDERTRAIMEMPISSGFLDVLDALITAWWEVRGGLATGTNCAGEPIA